MARYKTASPSRAPSVPSRNVPYAVAAASGAAALAIRPPARSAAAYTPASRQPTVLTNDASQRLTAQTGVQKTALQNTVDTGVRTLPAPMRARYKAEVGAPAVQRLPNAPGLARNRQEQALRAAANANPHGIREQSLRRIAVNRQQATTLDRELAAAEKDARRASKAAAAAKRAGDPVAAHHALRAAVGANARARGAGRGLYTVGAKGLRESLNAGAMRALTTGRSNAVGVAVAKRILDMRLQVPLPQSVARSGTITFVPRAPSGPWVLGEIDVRGVADQAMALSAGALGVRGNVAGELDHVQQALVQSAARAARGEFRVAAASFGAAPDDVHFYSRPYVLGTLDGFLDRIWTSAQPAIEAGAEKLVADASQQAVKQVTKKPSGRAAAEPPPPAPAEGGWKKYLLPGLAVAGAAGVATGAWFAFKK